MNVQFPMDEELFFSNNIPDPVRRLLQQAIDTYEETEKSEKLLLEAKRLAPAQLEVYIALYKFYFYKKRLTEAQKIAQATLEKAAEMGGFTADWKQLFPQSAQWTKADSVERVYLYTMKALGFIRLRLLDFAGSEEILNKLQILDPHDQVGGSVILELAANLKETVNG